MMDIHASIVTCTWSLSVTVYLYCFFFNDTATTEIYTYVHTLSLHDALPIWRKAAPARCRRACPRGRARRAVRAATRVPRPAPAAAPRSEEHTSELQSLMRNSYAVFCLKKKTKLTISTSQSAYIIHLHNSELFITPRKQ